MTSILLIIIILVLFLYVLLRNENQIELMNVLDILSLPSLPRKVFRSDNIQFVIANTPIYYINLNHSQDRRKKFENNFKGLNITRIEAIDGKTIQQQNNLTKYETACVLSHLKAIRTAYDNNDEYALIMEDDCSPEYLVNNIYIPIKKLTELGSEYEIIQLGLIQLPNDIIKTHTDTNLFIDKFYWSTVCYLIHRNGMKRILECKEPLTPADFYVYENLKYACTSIPYFTYDDGNTTIQINKLNPLLNTMSKQIWDSMLENVSRKQLNWYAKYVDLNENLMLIQ